ncbi:peptidase family M48 domain-containing protein [Hirsutella rhossiliensis]|uniref:Peptidase family m48 domain-containing protein n=1 Tax=Hirsutella rhossiliensis TaxID=111463 RepID=A0A9P8MWV9_9HYPO|nr:peptidase family m48 domain-containing protein [Hirsutella rhossiliensis]KAH0963773.1 peptidase family m48 domain-containing protein [Hirsutella rhossiliensis]
MLASRLVRPRCGFALEARLSPSSTSSSARLAYAVVPPLQHALITAARPRHLSHTRPRLAPPPDDPYHRLRHARPLVPDAVAGRFARAGRSRNSRALVVVCVAAAVAFYLYNSQTVPVTGRRRFNFLSDRLVARMYARSADAVAREVLNQGGHFLSDWDPRTMAVRRVMRRLIPVSGMADLDWEIHVIADNRTANAFVMPGGKVFVHSGILSLCRNDDALAAVLGHEIAHSTASHAAERLSAAWVGNLTAGSLFFLAGALPGLALFGLWSVVGGFYLQDLLFHLPMGRRQESEADYIGLMMMAEACYDPRAAVGFWRRMETLQHAGGVEQPEMLSTHPSNEHRIADIQQWMGEAMQKRMESDCRGTASFADRFRVALRRGQPVEAVAA